jgi:DNA modification methylase
LTPYYQRGDIRIYHGDCLAVLADIKADSVDVVVSDPPYGVNYESSLDMSEVLRAILRTLRRKRHVYLFGRYDLSAVPELVTPIELVWDKGAMSMGDLSLPWGMAHEPITFGVYIPSKSERAAGQGRLAARLRRGSVLSVPRPTSGKHLHPTEKPVRLLQMLIESSSMFDETVLDPFMGIGSTLIAAEREGRKSIGIEIEERYCEIAAKRLQAEVLPLESIA